MPKKYHIPVKTAPPRFPPVGRYATIEFREDCAGSCRECVKKKCIYGIFKENYEHFSTMDEPEYLYNCQSCFLCVQECTRGIFSRVINPDYRTLGDDHWRADIIRRLWYQAHTGKIPVSGAGYGGPFVAAGFDSMWTDMSEIVRPTRDGIHGREYISTCFEISRRITPLTFNEDLSLASQVSPILEIPIPLMFQLPRNLILNEKILISAANAARVLGTMMMVRPEDYTDVLLPFADNLIPCLTADRINDYVDFIQKSRAVELTFSDHVEDTFVDIRAINREIIILVRIPLDTMAASRGLKLAQTDVDTLHFFADENGNELNAEKPRFINKRLIWCFPEGSPWPNTWPSRLSVERMVLS